MPIPMAGGYSASDATNQSAAQKNDNGGASTNGYHNAIVNNYALGGSSLTSALASGGTLPVWAWVAMAAGLAGLAWWALKRKG